MNSSRASATVRIDQNFGPASQFANSHATFIQLKGRTDHEQGKLYLQLSLAALRELAGLLEHDRLSATDRSAYNRAYTDGKHAYDQAVKLRDQLHSQKKSFRTFVVNLFVRESGARHFRKITYQAYQDIKRTSDDLVRRLLPEKDDTLVSGGPGESAQGDASVCEENPGDVAERDLLSVTDLPPNQIIRGLNVDVHNEQEEQEVVNALSRIAQASQEEGEDVEEDDDDDSQTIKAPPSQSRPPSPSPSCTVNFYINQSMVSFDSESTGTTLNVGVDGGVRQLYI